MSNHMRLFMEPPDQRVSLSETATVARLVSLCSWKPLNRFHTRRGHPAAA